MSDEQNGSNWAENANVLAPVSAAGPLARSQRRAKEGSLPNDPLPRRWLRANGRDLFLAT